MSCDKCRWFNKNGFAFGTGECVLHRRVCGSGHKVCEQYEEYESRPHGEWIEKSQFDRLCKNCGQQHIGDKRFANFCPNCGASMRKEGESER